VADARRAVSAPARRPLASLRFFGLLLVIVAAFTGSGALTNNPSALRCDRIARPGGGPCTFERGSLGFASTEEFFAKDLVKADVLAGAVDIPNRAADGGGERISVVTKSDTMRFIDDDVWDHETRVTRGARRACDRHR
jgi:hypothetical protein